MKTNFKFSIHTGYRSFAIVFAVALVLWSGVLAGSAQTNDYLYSGSETNITLNPGTYDITAYGAKGGSAAGGVGGNGAEMEGQFSFATPVTLTLLVGGSGSSGSGGGGGGSFVVNSSTPLVIAGGGGGAGLEYSGAEGGAGLDLPEGGGGGGGGGLYGGGGGAAWGTGGGGFLVGGDGDAFGTGGSSFQDGGAGGISYSGSDGGYGGGGGGYYGGGGGGGYGGGGGGNYGSFGGGGGSIIDSYAVAIITEANGVASPDDSPNGEIIITGVLAPPIYPPVLLITNVTAGMSVSNAAFTVMGTASDNVAVSDVLYSLNNGAWTSAATTNDWTNWSAAVTLFPGTNTVAAYAVDTSGNISATDSVTIVALLTFSTAGDLFVPSYNGNIYKLTSAGAESTFVSLSGPSYGLAFSQAGDLYVSEMENPGEIIEFIPGAIPRTAMVATGLPDPVGMAFDKVGDLFASEPINGDIIEFTANGTQKTFASGLDGPLEPAFDKGGDLFVSSYNNVYEFTNNNGTLSSNPTIFVSGFSFAAGLAFDGAGDLFVADQGNNPGYGVIYEFTNNAGTLNTNSTVFASGLDQPWGLAFNSKGNLFEADSFSGNIYEFTPEGTKITFASGLNDPEGVCFEPAPCLAAAGAFRLTVSMPSPYYSTIVQGSEDLINWSNIYTNTPPFTFTDSTLSELPYRFYRALLGR